MSGCDSDRLEALVDDRGDPRAPETRAHVAACARCAEELDWLRAERRLFTARASYVSPDAPSPPPFAAVLAQVRRERWSRRLAPWIGFAAAAAFAAIVVGTRAPPAVAVAEPMPELACYDDPRSLAVEATAYATDRAIACAEDDYSACLMATPHLDPMAGDRSPTFSRMGTSGSARERSSTSAARAFPVEADVTCRSFGPLDDEVFTSRICGGSFQ